VRLKQDLISSGKLVDTKEAIYAKVWADYNAQLIHVRAQQDILGDDYNPLRTIPGRDEDGKFTFNKNVDVPKNYLSLEYLLYAFDVSQSTFKRLRKRGGESLEKQVPHNKGKCVLLDADLAACIYNARYFYVSQQMKMWKKKNLQASKSRRITQRKTFRKMWDSEKKKDAQFGAAYEKKERDHAARAKGANIYRHFNLSSIRLFKKLILNGYLNGYSIILIH